jgi:arachidonate 15-lipoxygenase
MNRFDSLLDCLTATLFPFVQNEPETTGTRTRGGLPLLSCPRAPGPLSLPQDDGCVERGVRSGSRAASRCLYRYKDAPGFDMPFASPVSAYLSAPMVQAIGQAKAQSRAFQNQRNAQAFADDRARFDSFDDFRKVIIEYPLPAIADRWRQDRAFCDQMLAGFDPITIQRVTKDRRGIGSDWAALSAKLNPGVIAAVTVSFNGNIDAGIAAGRLYVADYEELKEAGPTFAAVGAESGEVPMAPIALFARAKDHGGLDAIAIQLDQSPRSAFNAPDGSADWMVARSYVQAASYQLTQVVYHLTLHHLIEEAFALTTMRQLPELHPLMALLNHHFAGLMPINTGTINQFFGGATGQYLLVGKRGGENLANARYARWRFEQLDFVADLERRGVDDPALLPYYPHRDDLMLYWNLLRDFTHDYLALYYRDDRDVAGDYELQAWASELSRKDGGLGDVPGFPARIRTFDALHDIVHLLIFTAGPHHASLNYSQLDYATFVPNMPAASYLLPTGGFDERTLLNLMPPTNESIGQTTMSYQADYYMGQMLDYANYYCGCWNRDARNVVSRYRAELLDYIAPTIRARNIERAEQGALIYPFVLPVNVPNSTSA